MNILVINCGSSSIKYKFYDMPAERLIAKGSLDNIGEKGSKIRNHRQGLEVILKEMEPTRAKARGSPAYLPAGQALGGMPKRSIFIRTLKGAVLWPRGIKSSPSSRAASA